MQEADVTPRGTGSLADIIRAADQAVRSGEWVDTSQLPPPEGNCPDWVQEIVRAKRLLNLVAPPLYSPLWTKAQIAAMDERKRLAIFAFQASARRFWPEMAKAATSIDETNAMAQQLRVAFASQVLTRPDLSFSLQCEIDEQQAQALTGARPQTHQRAGITKSKRRGQAKARRRMAAQSRRKNRRARA